MARVVAALQRLDHLEPDEPPARLGQAAADLDRAAAEPRLSERGLPTVPAQRVELAELLAIRVLVAVPGGRVILEQALELGRRPHLAQPVIIVPGDGPAHAALHREVLDHREELLPEPVAVLLALGPDDGLPGVAPPLLREAARCRARGQAPATTPAA